MLRSSFTSFLIVVLCVGAVSDIQGDESHGLAARANQRGFVIEVVNGQKVCRNSRPQDGPLLENPDPATLRVIYDRSQERRGGVAANGVAPNAGGFRILLRSTAQLDSFPSAKAAFIRAAQKWEALIANPITVYVDVDYGPTRFGQPWGNQLGSTSSAFAGGETGDYERFRQKLAARADNATESTAYSNLPAGTLPTDLGAASTSVTPAIQLRAIGFLPATAAPSDTAPTVGFNSSQPFDFDPSNGIDPGKYDFEGTAVHEIGHALGFVSFVGFREVEELKNAPPLPSIFDFFRFRPGVSNSTFRAAQRPLTTGGEHVYFAGLPALRMSTGNLSGEGGDSNQASHWKADELTGVFVGIMDPTGSPGEKEELTANDLAAFGMMGYNIVSGNTGAGCNESEPNETIATASTLTVGTPCSGSASIADVSNYKIDYNDGTSDRIEDVFKVTLSSAAKLKASLTFTGNADLDLFILAANGSSINLLKNASTAAKTEVAETDANLQPGTYYIGVSAFEGSSPYTLTVTTSGGGSTPVTPSQCVPSSTTVCLLDNRFRVSIDYVNQFVNPPKPGAFVGAKLVAGVQNPDVATFGISAPQAIEVVVRLQDVRPFGVNRFDIYYGGVTDLEYTVSITDTQTGRSRTYRNLPGTVGGGVDRSTFLGASLPDDQMFTSGGFDRFVYDEPRLQDSLTVRSALPKSATRPSVPDLRVAGIAGAAMNLQGVGRIAANAGGGAACSEAEPNETAANASPLTIGTPCTGNATFIDPSGITIDFGNGDTDKIEDLYRVTLSSPAKLTVRLSYSISSADLDVYLLSSSNLLGQAATNDNPEQFTTSSTLPAGTYYVGVSAYSGASPYTLLVTSSDSAPAAPAAPSNLAAAATSSTQIVLTWRDNSTNETGFVVEARIGNSGWGELGLTEPNVTSVPINSVPPGTTVTFRVKARNASGDSAYSNEASATTPGGGGPCVVNATTTCLLDNRFRVSIAYTNTFANPPQPGNFLGAKLVAGSQNPDVATFGISSAQAIEVVVRIQDVRPFGVNRFDVYYGGLTDLPYTVAVTDTQTGRSKSYTNAAGNVGGGVDRSTFTY